MQQFRWANFGVMDWVGAAFSTPLVSLALALVVASVFFVFTGGRVEQARPVALTEGPSLSVNARYMPERRTLGVAALGVIVVFVAENVIRGYLLNLVDVVSWWRFATPVASSCVAVAVLLALIISRGSGASETPAVTGARRTWMTFAPRVGLILSGVVLVALVATTIAAGVASAADSRGRHVWLEIFIPNEAAIDPIRVWFFGWAYGIPVLVALAALIATTWGALHANAARPYIRPETVAVERTLRREVAGGAVFVATGGMLLALAGAWRLIASAGSASQLMIEDQNGGKPYEAVWRYAELSTAAGWLAPALEITAFTLLLLIAGRLRRTSSTPRGHRDALVDVAEAGR